MALRWSAKNGHTNIVKLLLNKGANVHANYNEALYLSDTNGHFDTVKILLEKVKINMVFESGYMYMEEVD